MIDNFICSLPDISVYVCVSTHTHTHTQSLSLTMILKRRTYLPVWTWSERATGLPTELKTATPVFQEPACKVSSRWIQKELFFTTTEAVSLGALGFKGGTPGPYAQSPAGGEPPSPGKQGPVFAIPLVMLLFRIIMRNRDYMCVCVHACTDTHTQIYLAERDRIAITCQVAFKILVSSNGAEGVLQFLSRGRGSVSGPAPGTPGCVRSPGLVHSSISRPPPHSPLASLTPTTPQG